MALEEKFDIQLDEDGEHQFVATCQRACCYPFDDPSPLSSAGGLLRHMPKACVTCLLGQTRKMLTLVPVAAVQVLKRSPLSRTPPTSLLSKLTRHELPCSISNQPLRS